MNFSLESWRNRFIAIQAIDQPVRLFLGFLEALKMMVLLVSSYKNVCILLYVNFKMVYKKVSPQFNSVFARNDQVHVSYTKVNISVHVVLIISMLHASKFSIQVAYLFDAPLTL